KQLARVVVVERRPQVDDFVPQLPLDPAPGRLRELVGGQGRAYAGGNVRQGVARIEKSLQQSAVVLERQPDEDPGALEARGMRRVQPLVRPGADGDTRDRRKR